MWRHVFAVVLLALLGAVLLVLMRPRIAYAQLKPRSCSIPKSAGQLRGTPGEAMLFEGASGTLSIYNQNCQLWLTVTRN